MAIEYQNTKDDAPPTATRYLALHKSLFSRAKVTPNDRRFFTEQLALMLETGANLHQGLQLLAEQNQSAAMTEVIESLLSDVAGGRSFSASLARHPHIFSTTYVNLVSASEGGGFLHPVLTELLEMEEKAEEMNTTVRSALAYPIFLSVFSLGVVVFVLVVVFPKFGNMFAKIHDQLPMTTIVLMHASDLLRVYWMYILAAVLALTTWMIRWTRSSVGRDKIDRLKLSLPGIRHVYMQIYLTQSLRVMSLSLANGVNIVDTLASTRDVVSNKIMQRFFRDVEEQVQQGNGLAAGFSRDEIIPVLVQRMIATGEESGNLPKVMSRLSDYYQRELTKRLKSLSKMAEPVMLMVMGLIVGVIVSSLILPIFKLSRAVT